MKKSIITFVLAIGFHVAGHAQCGLNYQEMLDKYCQGVYLQHMELDNYSDDNEISLVLKENNRYAFYLLNPNNSIPVYRLTSEKRIPVSNEVANYTKDGKFASYAFKVNETCKYTFTYNFNTTEPSCVLLAIYLQNKIAFDPGIYKTFEEFKYNKPSVKLNFDITEKSTQVGMGKNAEVIMNYRLDLSRNKAKSIGEIYGFSNGKNLFINTMGGKTGFGKDFVKVHIYGEYGYYDQIGHSTIAAGSVVTTTTYVEHMLININSGEITSLNVKNLREFLSDDADLLEAFEKESRKQSKIKEYILKYLEKQDNGSSEN